MATKLSGCLLPPTERSQVRDGRRRWKAERKWKAAQRSATSADLPRALRQQPVVGFADEAQSSGASEKPQSRTVREGLKTASVSLSYAERCQFLLDCPRW